MGYGGPRLLTPPREEEEVYPYRRVWSSIILELSGVVIFTAVLYVLMGYIGVRVPDSLTLPVNVLIALWPALLWGVFSWWRERFAVQPRRSLAGVFIVSALVANAVSIPLLDALETSLWLPSAGFFNRIIGYAVTIGIVHEFSKYVVLRYMIWPRALRIRLDALAYCMAAAIGYAVVMNLRLALAGTTLAPDVLAMRAFGDVTLHIAASAFLAYGLAEMQFRPRTFFVMPFMLLLSILVTGIAITLRSNVINAKFFLGFSATRPLFGLAISFGIVVASLVVVAFLFNTAERQEREAVASRET